MTKLFIGNIPNSFDEKQVANWVETFGFPVESVEIIRDRSTGNTRGFGFICLKDGPQESEVVQCLNGQRMGERVMTISSTTYSRAS